MYHRISKTESDSIKKQNKKKKIKICRFVCEEKKKINHQHIGGEIKSKRATEDDKSITWWV